LQTASIERSIGAQGHRWSLSFADRCLIAGRAVWFYVGKLAWPANLTFIYPRWTIDPAVWWQWLFPAATVGLFSALWLWRHRLGRGPFAAAAFFVGTLGPALGFINFYPMRYSFVADHFQYLASIAVFALAAAVVHTQLRPAIRARWFLEPALAALVLLLLGVLSFRQAETYADLETLWRRTLANNDACSMAHNNLGNILNAKGETEEGFAHLSRAVELDPDNPEARDSLGTALLDRGQLDDAAAHFRRALEIRPHPGSTYNLGTVLLRQGRLDEAIAQLEEAGRLQPANELVHNNLGNAYFGKGEYDKAAEEYRQAIAIRPNFPEAANNLGSALLQQGQIDAAAERYQAALAMRPGFEDAANNLRQIAWLMATSPDAAARNGTRAVEIAQMIDHMSGGQNAVAVATLAAAYAEAGRFSDAAAAARRAMQLGQSDAAFVALLRAQRELYERNQPYRDAGGNRAAQPPAA